MQCDTLHIFCFFSGFTYLVFSCCKQIICITMPEKWISSRYLFGCIGSAFTHKSRDTGPLRPKHKGLSMKTKNPSGPRKPAQEDERNHLKDFEQTITNFCDGWPSVVWSLYKLMFGGPRPTSSHLLGLITIRPPGALPSMWWGEEVVYERCWFFIADSAKNTDKKLHNVHYIILT